MNILQLCNKPPFPPVDGGTIVMNSATQGLLSAGCNVKVFSAYSDKHPVLSSQITNEYRKQTKFEAVYFDLNINPFQALKCFLAGKSYHIKRFINKDFERRLTEILQEDSFDVVHMDSIFLTPYVETIRKHSQAKIVLRAHNVEHLIWKRIADHTVNPFKRVYLKHVYATLRRYELEHLSDYDGIDCLSEVDSTFFKSCGISRPMVVLPAVITTPNVVKATPVEENSLFHIGSMDWMPNDEGIGWFLKDVLPLITAKLPEVKVYLAGRKMPKKYFDYARTSSNLTVLGEVDDALDFMEGKQINVVPLLSGSGFRVKIVEAMSLGKLVITTTVGAEGIAYEDGKHLLIADTPERFVSQIEKCINDKSLCETIGENARQLIREEYDIEKVTQKLLDFYNTL